MDMIKNQILTISAMKSTQATGQDNSMMHAIYGIILLSIFEQIVKVLPTITEFIKTHVGGYIEKKYKKTIDNISLSSTKKEITSSIRLERNYTDKDGQSGEYVESILEFISKLSNIKKLKYRNRFYISHMDEFDIEKDVFGKCHQVDYNIESGDVEKIIFDIYSTSFNIQELRTFLTKINKNYLISKKNQLGDQTYFFDHFITNNERNIPIIRFDMVPFHTNKSLKNIYGSYMKNIVNRIQFFIHNKDWYYKKGIPHTLGLLLHGPPGTGKTSLIKAIANDTHRHIINIKLTNSVTQTQLKALFFNEEILIFNKKTGQNEIFIIPLDQRIYVMEDVDAISEILYSREYHDQRKKMEEEKEKAEQEQAVSVAKKNGYPAPAVQSSQKTENKEELTLAFILNLLDGILETPGRIVILTTNHPEKLDSALVRPGRIDINVCFGFCSNETIIELVKNFYESIDYGSNEWINFAESLEHYQEYLITPAEVNRIIFNYYTEPSIAYTKILDELKEKMNRNMEEPAKQIYKPEEGQQKEPEKEVKVDSPKEENTNLSEEEKTTLAKQEAEEFGKLSLWQKQKSIRDKNIASNSETKTMVKEKEEMLKRSEESNNVGFIAANSIYDSFGGVSGQNVQSSMDDFFKPLI